MRINHDNKYVFIHIPKNAGKSINRLTPGKMIFGGNAHDDAKCIIREFGRETLDAYFIFAFVRNPWDRLFSLYNFSVKVKRTTAANVTFKQWLFRCDHMLPYEKQRLDGIPHQIKPQLNWLVDDNGEFCVDFVGKVEHLQRDFDTVCDNTGLKRGKLEHLNGTSHRPYVQAYDDEMREFVADHHKIDIDRFGYKFGKETR